MIKPRKAVMEMEEYNPPTSGRENYMRLDFNENTIGCSKNVISALSKIKAGALAAYPEYTKLRKILADYCKVNAEEIIAANGTDEAIKTIIETYISKSRDEIIIPVPTYAMFKFYAQLNEAIINEIEYNRDLSFPTGKILKAINKKTKLVILVNPNNPTGTSIKNSNILRIIKKAKLNGTLVLIDEAYCQFYGKTAIPLIKKYDNLFVTQTLSKAFGLAGLRLGYIASNKENIKIVQKTLSPYSVNKLAVVCASAALKDLSYTKKYCREVKKNKLILYKEFVKLGIKYYKSDANFILLRIGPQSAQFCQKLREKGILVRDRSSDVLLNGCVRITLGTVKQTKKLIKALRQTIKEINPQLIFDIDGVLVDVSKSYRAAIKQTADFFTGKKVTLEEIQNYKESGGYNNDWDLTAAIVRSKRKDISKEKVINKFQSFYKKSINNERWILNKKILQELSDKYSLAILTGRPRKEVLYVLRKNKVKKYFSEIIAMQNVSKQKPNPEGILKILKQSQKTEAFYFGDTIDDMKAAISAKITAIGILPPRSKSPRLKKLLIKCGAKIVLKNINQIQEALK